MDKGSRSREAQSVREGGDGGSMRPVPGPAIGWGYQTVRGQSQVSYIPCPGHLPPGRALKLTVGAGLGPGLGFEVRSKAKTSLDGALERARRDEMSPRLPHQDAPGAEPVTWEMVGLEPAMVPLAVGSPGPEEASGEQTETGKWNWL